MLNLMIAMTLLSAPAEPAPTFTAVPLASRISRQPSPDAARVYDELRSRKARERGPLLARMPASTQSDVWTHHFLTVLVEHPEFTTDQRAVIQEALSLLNPELFEIEPSSPLWTERVDKPLRRLQERAKAAFSDRAFAKQLFTQFGPEPGPGDISAASPPAASLMQRFGQPGKHAEDQLGTHIEEEANAVNCTCSVVSDWCDTYGGLGILYCKNTWCKLVNGCGTLFRYVCEGLCFYNRPA